MNQLSPPEKNAQTNNSNEDRVFLEEQVQLSHSYQKLCVIEQNLKDLLQVRLEEALADKEELFDDMTRDFSEDIQLETLAELEATNRIIEAYNVSANINEEKLRRAQLLLKAPYFAKIKLRFEGEDEAKDIYIGAAGMTDENRRHFIIDWRSPVAEVYYNQEQGHTSYEAHGRTIEVDLELRRQFSLHKDVLNAYFDTSVAIEDPLLLTSLAQHKSSHLESITATIQKEQNRVIRHEDVPVLLVGGIAGSGKTSVLLQRIAYLFYTKRDNLSPDDVFLLTPNPVFENYIDSVLPNMGERNPHIITWDNLMSDLHLAGRGVSRATTIETLATIDERVKTISLDKEDFRELCINGEQVITVNSVRSSVEKFAHLPYGPHRFTLAMEDMKEKVLQRIKRLSTSADEHEKLLALSADEQLSIFGQHILPIGDEELPARTYQWLTWRYAGFEEAIEQAQWLRLDRIGKRVLSIETLDVTEWLYLKLALVGGGKRNARYVMIDEVQDYTAAQLMVLERYFHKAHFLLLGDENQAIKRGCVSFGDVREIFRKARGRDAVCQQSLMTSYRSSPEITDLFCKLLPSEVLKRVSSVQKPGTQPVVLECDSETEYLSCLRNCVMEASGQEGLVALIAFNRQRAKELARLLQDTPVITMKETDGLPDKGVVLFDIALVKGLEFDRVILPDVDEDSLPHEPLCKHKLYTAISRATKQITLLAQGKLTSLLR